MHRLRTSLHTSRQLAPLVGQLMTPVALTGYLMAAWRLGADLNWFGDFFISRGLLSRWQVWAALAAATHMAGNQMRRNGRIGGPETPGS